MKSMFEGTFGKVGEGLCTLSPNGIAVKTSSGYKSYNVKTGRITNCDGLTFNLGEGMFFVIPTSKVKPGDIILRNGQPVCVRKVNRDSIEIINYETSAVETILPERHMFMGNTWFCGKIVSMFGDGASITKKGGMNKMMKFLMLQSVIGNMGTYEKNPDGTLRKSSAATGGAGMNTLLPFIMMGDGNMFEGMFDDTFDEDEENLTEAENEEDEEDGENA